jgi:hypothetical protein
MTAFCRISDREYRLHGSKENRNEDLFPVHDAGYRVAGHLPSNPGGSFTSSMGMSALIPLELQAAVTIR